MKEYPKTYEDIFTGERAQSKCKIEKIDFDKEEITVPIYSDYFKKTLKESFDMLWMTVVRLNWLSSRFKYNGYRREKFGRNNFPLDSAFSLFSRKSSGHDYRFFAKAAHVLKLSSYFKDFFPEFDDKNPFKEPEYYKLPYEHIHIDFLFLVHQMPERLELLDLAEKRKMSYDKFVDYVTNHAYCQNDELNEKLYDLMVTRTCPQYIRNNKTTYEGKNKRKKRRKKRKKTKTSSVCNQQI